MAPARELWAAALCLACTACLAAASADQVAQQPLISPEHRTMAFVYLWYGNPEHDGDYKHWNHEVLPHWQEHVSRQYPQVGRRFQPPGELHSPFYPLRGPYSSADQQLLVEQFQEMKAAGIGVAVVSWWGPAWRNGTHDTQGVSTDDRLPTLLAAAERAGIAVAFHLEPYHGRSADTVREDLQYLMRRPEVAASPAILRLGPRRLPLYFVYDSYHIAPADWAALLMPLSESSLRGGDGDGVFIGLWLNAGDGNSQLLPGGFDGADTTSRLGGSPSTQTVLDRRGWQNGSPPVPVRATQRCFIHLQQAHSPSLGCQSSRAAGAYTYFASEAVSYGANPANWLELAAWARQHGRLFIPSVGPGYDDSRIRPWNAAATRSREGGARYRRWWQAALAVQPAAVSITSYNEWGEGTQIEPAKAFPAPNGSSMGSSSADADGSSSGGSSAGGAGGGEQQYQSYGGQPGQDEWLYMNITAEYASQLQQQQGTAQAASPGPQHTEL